MNYEKYLIDLFKKPLTLMRNLQLTPNEVYELELTGITPDGFNLEKLTKLMLSRYQKQEDTKYYWKDNILWIECPYENDEFKSNMIRFIVNFPQFEIKFIPHGYQFE